MTKLGEWRHRVRTRNEAQVDVLAAVAAKPLVEAVPTTGPVSDALYARLSAVDVARLEAALEGNMRLLWDDLDEGDRHRLLLSAAAFYQDPEALKAIGLTSAEPPDDVHAMARGPLAHGGDLGIADMVVRTLEDARVAIPAGGTLLDFGCSSGRVLRPLAAWRPDLNCIGCDPNGDAITWAQQAVPDLRWFQSPLRPPLEPCDDASVDVAFAISIWSHFSADAALDWLGEMHRIIKPGGALLLTTHGLNTFAEYTRGGLMDRAIMARTIGTVLTDGIEFIDVFGEAGDWGVKDPDWGNSFLLADWLVEHATPQWSIRLLRSGRLEGNQDAYVLERT
ncbi:hypothetical protein DSM112329_04926 [Paraconexibacter sp. AEG42_29]|uniref:Methyltransferase domain-containing protein n=1 Tax=Paraconexibacter sp. AEG42_29 TaxID=2997339 RepID=A0AAU7B2D2_9ACTN